MVKAEPPISASGDPSTDPANLTPPPGAQQMEVAGREGGAEGAGAAAVGVKAEPSQDSLMQEASLQVGNDAQHVMTTCFAKIYHITMHKVSDGHHQELNFACELLASVSVSPKKQV